MSSAEEPLPTPGATNRRWSGARLLIAVAVTASLAVAVMGGVRSFEAVSQRFGSPLVPLTADGMIVACTALRLAALSRGWRLPGSLVTTYLFIAGTVWLNVASAHGWSDAVAHGLAPVAYAVLVELLAHMLRLHLRLSQPRRPRVSALTWFTSPVITTRVWLHLARTGADDPVGARALVQQVVRMSSRLRAVCPNGWHPFDGAWAARTAALHTIRDGLLSAGEVAALLPDADQLKPSELLARIDSAALHNAPEPMPAVAQVRTTVAAPVQLIQPASVQQARPKSVQVPEHAPVHGSAPAGVPMPVSNGAGRITRNEHTDDELVAEVLRHSQANNGGEPLSGREVMRLLGVGTPKARRLVELAGWAHGRPANNREAKADPPPEPTAERDVDLSGEQVEMSDAR